jgi:hypothetical protein
MRNLDWQEGDLSGQILVSAHLPGSGSANTTLHLGTPRQLSQGSAHREKSILELSTELTFRETRGKMSSDENLLFLPDK